MIIKTARKCRALAHSAGLHLRRKGADQHASMLTESPLLVMVEKYDSEGDSFVFQNDWQNRLYWGQDHRTWEGSLWRTTAERNSLCWWIFLAFCTVIPAVFRLFSPTSSPYPDRRPHWPPSSYLKRVIGSRATQGTLSLHTGDGIKLSAYSELRRILKELTRVILASFGLPNVFCIIKTWTLENAFRTQAKPWVQWG